MSSCFAFVATCRNPNQKQASSWLFPQVCWIALGPTKSTVAPVLNPLPKMVRRWTLRMDPMSVGPRWPETPAKTVRTNGPDGKTEDEDSWGDEDDASPRCWSWGVEPWRLTISVSHEKNHEAFDRRGNCSPLLLFSNMAWQLSVQVCSEETNGQLEAQRLLSTLRAFELEECCETSLLVNLTADCPSKFLKC